MSQNDVLTVSEFVSSIKTVVADAPQFKNVAIVGELSNFTAHSSGHFYFSLKDKNASIRSVMFRSSSSKVLFKPKNGDKVVIIGELGVYEESGSIQFYARQMNLDGLGDLYIKFEQLKKELFEKGLFDASHKKEIPKYPSKIGVITGANSAAYADMSRTLQERWPMAQQVDYFSLVQGESAKDSLVANIEKADADKLDVILLARGGGSIEDLWPFNELEVVISVFNAQTPIISGVGHESDTTLVDFVSDYRAATPTAAAVMATPDQNEILDTIRNTKNKMYQATRRKYLNQKQVLDTIMNTKVFKNPLSLLDKHYMKLDLLNSKLLEKTKMFHETQKYLHGLTINMSMKLNMKIHLYKNEVNKYNEQNKRNLNLIHKSSKDSLMLIDQRIYQAMNMNLDKNKQELIKNMQTINNLSPFNTMQRGYSVASHDMKIVKSIEDVNQDDILTIRVKDGKIHTKVLNKEGI
ncbi:MAG: exodeoxyribonuclease VII large subunit [Erysipelothrix sp.]|nr:exodeoxyribonuclease VII large subunit [Erysipelothrix sp.]